MEITKITSGDLSGEIYCADAIDMLEEIGEEMADIVFLDPPFNLGKTYCDTREIDRKPTEEYERWMTNVIDKSIAALKPGGALFVYHLPIWAMRIGAYAERRLLFRQ